MTYAVFFEMCKDLLPKTANDAWQFCCWLTDSYRRLITNHFAGWLMSKDAALDFQSLQ
jgi:hypothetical protein